MAITYDGTLVGKTVNIYNKSLLEFMYPGYEIRERLFFDMETKVIYTGKFRKDIHDYLSHSTKSYINTSGPYEIDLDDKEIFTRFVYSKWGKEPKEEVLEVLKNLSDDDFNDFIKTYWVSGKSKLDKVDTTIFDLYKSFGKSKNEVLTVYFKLLDTYSVNMIESSILTFLEKSANFEDVEASGYYLKLLKDFHDKHNRSKVKNVLLKYQEIDDNKETKLLWLLLQF